MRALVRALAPQSEPLAVMALAALLRLPAFSTP
jgi:hypothetical protein